VVWQYPYPTITLVDPPYGAGGAGGMEYPTLIAAGTRWRVSPRRHEPEGVVVHEFGHQYWYGMIANNEFEEAGSTRASILTRPVRSSIGLRTAIPAAAGWMAARSRHGLGCHQPRGVLSGAKKDSLLRNAGNTTTG